MNDLARYRGRQYFAKFAWAVLAYNIPVILWGAYVRASFSGDGCGAHWPFCSGTVIPQNMAARTAIEFTHRAMTSVDVIAAIILCAWAFGAFPRKHPVRRYSMLSLMFLFIEALLGAGLVLLRYVARDQSAGRVWYLSAHLTNTMLLLGALTITAWLATNNAERMKLGSMPPKILGALATALFVSITGAIAALGDTLFPASSLGTGVAQDFSTASNALLRLRVVHPAFAVLGAAYVIWVATKFWKAHDGRAACRTAAWVVGITTLQLVAGALNIALLAPIWMQLFHLLVADALWIALVMLALDSSKVSQQEHELVLTGSN